MKKIIIIIINSVILLSCYLKKAPLSDDINASLNQFYYKTPENNVCFLYRKNIYSYSEFVQKYDVKSFRKVKIIKDKNHIRTLTKDKNCTAVIHVMK